MRRFPLTRSHGKGVPCIWESGGGYRNTGGATIVAGPDGSPKRPIYVRRRGHLAGGEHALIPVRVGDLVITADHHREDFTITIDRIQAIDSDDAVLEAVAEFDQGEWDHPEVVIGPVADAVEAAMEKATCYHCREPHYITDSVRPDLAAVAAGEEG